ncbi:Y-family DNA polymerase, partial [Loktanella sp. DJP18]|uniref:Y-family DNA polymerase n=1 Tax=Loktanella sp. DJP18 TaxID=3409788 RepID=UPI003BB57BA9
MTQSARGQARGVERLYLDFDSFFASAEQHFNPSLRGRPVGVVPLDSPHTGCIAVSRQAKALGVKSGAKIKDAKAIIPDMVFVVARHDVYVRLHKRILDVIDTIIPVTKVRSIDEVVCNLTPREAAEGAALATRLKAALASAFSDTLTCSIGMAPTELLAKIAAELKKPDGFVLIEADDMPARLAGIDLDDLPGISKGMHARLTAANVHDFSDLWNLAPKQARAIWGSVEGERFWNGIHGYHTERPETKKSMFGHSRMLPGDWRTPDKVR